MGPEKPIHKEEKIWGHEIWIHNSEDYCGKILVLKKGKKSSLHYHIKKKETFYIESGQLLMRIADQPGESGKLSEFVMQEGDTFNIEPFFLHQFIGIDTITKIIELSTKHFETDTIRID